MTISLKKQHNAHSAQAQPLQTHHSGIKLEISDFQTIIKISRQRAIKKKAQGLKWKSQKQARNLHGNQLKTQHIKLRRIQLRQH